MKSYEVVVLGAGPGGYVAAIRASQLGLRTAIVEGRFFGGVCLNIGCIPSKALLRNAELVDLLRRDAETFGIGLEGGGRLRFDYAAAVRRSRRVADGRARGVRYLMRKNHIDEHEGWGRFVDPHTLEVARAAGGTETLRFDHAIVATGARPRRLPFAPPSPRIVTYEEQIVAEEIPARVAIVGAGPIGLEFAHLFASYGAQVTLLEAAARVAPLEDEEISAFVGKEYGKRGIEVVTSAQVEGLEETGAAVRVTLRTGETRRTLEVDRVLQAIGFVPRTDGFGLEATGIARGARGEIAIDDRMRTNVPHLYAIGDVTAKLMLAHTAEAMGLAAAEAIAGQEPAPLDYAMMPKATFGHPQIASFGYTEAQARAQGLDVVVSKFPFQANGKAQGIGDYAGFVKLVGTRAGGIVGAHLVGPEVTELLPELTLAQAHELGAHEIARNVHAHPTLGEAVMEAAHGIGGAALHL